MAKHEKGRHEKKKERRVRKMGDFHEIREGGKDVPYSFNKVEKEEKNKINQCLIKKIIN